MKYLIVLLLALGFTSLFGHEEHRGLEKPNEESVQSTVEEFSRRPQSWAEWMGGFHFIFLHFPIALITMAAISELAFIWYQKPIFDYASQFMLIAAAIFATPTAIFGLIYSYTTSYEGLLADFIRWHMWFGIATAIFAIIVAFLRERYGISKPYYACLFILFVLVNITGFLGSGMTFGLYHMLPPL